MVACDILDNRNLWGLVGTRAGTAILSCVSARLTLMGNSSPSPDNRPNPSITCCGEEASRHQNHCCRRQSVVWTIWRKRSVHPPPFSIGGLALNVFTRTCAATPVRGNGS